MPNNDLFKKSVTDQVKGEGNITFTEKNLHHAYQKNTTAAWANQEEKSKKSNIAMPSEFEAYMAREWVNENQK